MQESQENRQKQLTGFFMMSLKSTAIEHDLQTFIRLISDTQLNDTHLHEIHSMAKTQLPNYINHSIYLGTDNQLFITFSTTLNDKKIFFTDNNIIRIDNKLTKSLENPNKRFTMVVKRGNIIRQILPAEEADIAIDQFTR